MSFGHNKQKNSSMNSKEELNDRDACDEQDLEQIDYELVLKKSVEDIISGSQEAIGNSISQALSFTSSTVLQSSPIPLRRSPSPSDSPHNSPRQSYSKREHSKYDTHLSVHYNANDTTEDSISKSSDRSNLASNNDLSKSFPNDSTNERPKSVSKISERAKKKSWYNVLHPSYKSRSEDFKKLFKDVADDERLVVDSVALSVVHLSPLGSQMSFAQPPTTRIENVADWEAIAKKYRALNGGDAEDSGSLRDSEDNASHLSETVQQPPPQAQVGNNVNANAMGNQV